MKISPRHRRIAKFKRVTKGVSAVIAVLLMIAIAVIAALVAYFWVTGYFRSTSTKVSKAIQIQSAYYTGQYLGIYVQNVGQGKATLIASQCLYVDGVLQGSARINPDALQQTAYTLQESDTSLLVDRISLNLGQTIKIKVVTDEGTFVEYSFTINTFNGQNPYSLTVNVEGQGTVSLNDTGPYYYGDVVQLTANANSGWTFSGWSQDLIGSTNPTTILIDGSKTVNATFTQNQYNLTMYVSGQGSVLPGNNTYPSGTSVDIKAISPAGWTFTGWSGGASGLANTTIVMNGDNVVNATFVVILDHFGFDTINSPQVAGAAFNITITAQDQYGDTVTNYAGTSTLSDSTGTMSPTSTGAFVNGVWTGTVIITKAATSVTISTSGDSASGVSNAFTVNSGAAASFALSGYPTSATAGSSFSITLTAVDQYSNIATGYVGKVHFSSTDTQAGLPVDYQFVAGDKGTHTFTAAFTLKTTGSWTITVIDGSLSATTSSITVNAGAIASFTLAGYPSSVTAGQSFGSNNVVMTAYDAYGNVKVDYAGAVTFTSSDGHAVLPSSYQFTSGTGNDNGVHTFAGTGFTLKTAGSQTITVTDGSISATSNAIIVNAVVLDHFTISGYPTSVTAGQSFGGVVVTAYDASNNIITSYVGQVYFTSTDSSAALPYTATSKYTFTFGDSGVHTFSGFTLNTAGSRTITVTDGTKSATTTAITVISPSSRIDYNTAISPTSATTGSSVSFTYTITRELSYNNLGWASIQVPAGFTITGTPTVTDSNPPGGTWVATVAGNTITVHASGTSSELTTNGQYARVTFTLTVPATAGIYGPFTSTVYQSYDKSGYGPGTLDGNDPTVTVYKAGVLDHFTIAGYPSSRTVGQNFGSNNVVITAYDGGNNILTGYAGQIYFTSSDSQAVLPYTSGSKYTFVSGDNGVHTFAGTGFTLETVGSQTITVTDVSVSVTSNSITVSPGAASKLVFTSGVPQTLNVGQVSGQITVQMQDQNGNPVSSGITVTLASSSAGGLFFSDSGGSHPITSVTIQNGHSDATFYYQDVSAGSPTLTASHTGLTSAISQFTINGQSVEPRYSTSINPAQVAVGSPTSFTVRVTMQSTFEVDISYVTITIPAGFTGITVNSPTSDAGTWTQSLAGNVITLTSSGISSDLEDGTNNYVQVVFRATPQAAGNYTFAISIYGHVASDSTENHNLGPGTNTGSDPSVTVYTPVSITITSSPSGQGFVIVDGNAITTPTTFNWQQGSTHTLQANSPVSGGTGVHYVYTGWSDSGAQTHTYTVPNSGATVTAVYATQYQLTMGANFGTFTPATGGWYNLGSVVTITAAAPSAGNGERYVWVGWTGTGNGSYTGTDNPANAAVTMNSAITETATWRHQYQVTVTASPSGAIGGTFAATYTNSGTTYTNEQHTTSWNQWTDASTTVTASSPQSPFNGYTFSSYTNNGATMNSAQTITLVYSRPPQTVTLRPNGAGHYSELSQYPNSGNHYDKVSETTSDGDATYVYTTSTSTQRDSYTFTSTSATGTINSVTIYIVARATNSGTASTVVRISGTSYYGTSNTLTTSYTPYSTQYTLNPDTNAAWTWADVSSLDAGVRLARSSGQTDARCTQIYVVVNYTPP
ncbi:MAG: archaellin/type IV pilin N-terminal domain-containing protein [Candidatus Bathyarchaeia archaeon]|jgi:hypothetical protein